jgi:hypothetical protein
MPQKTRMQRLVETINNIALSLVICILVGSGFVAIHFGLKLLLGGL